MSFSTEEVRMLSQGDSARQWAPIPEHCPPYILEKICEFRAAKIGLKPAVVHAAPENTDLRMRLAQVSLF
ncbi:MAG TPA: hypothetical protein VNW47_09480 [Terriglobales bacterium]|jgi:hypothetical protein|nr:hypothetical protein [Terriglobales bacterium]